MMRKFSGYSHFKIVWNQHQINQKDGCSPSNELSPPSSSSGAKISPAIVFAIVILAVLVFVSGLLHLLIRFLTKLTSTSQSYRNAEDYRSSDALQRQLRQLFDSHDTGLDQVDIDALPVFSYKEISGPKDLFDCAVCLCEFSESDDLRLLPICSHAFHINCIDTWLLSHSTCPLCRRAIMIPEFSFVNPVFNYDDISAAEEEEEEEEEEKEEEEEDRFHGFVVNGYSNDQKRAETEENATEKGVFPVRLGKFQSLNGVVVGAESSSSSALDARRCYSMGSYQYVVGNAELRVALSRVPMGRDSKRVKGDESRSSAFDSRCYSLCSHQNVVGNAKHRVSLSLDQMEMGSYCAEGDDLPTSTLDVDGNAQLRDASSLDQTGRGLDTVEEVGQASNPSDESIEGRKICIGSKTDSYSVSKTWLWSKNGRFATSSGVQSENESSPNLNSTLVDRTNGI